VQIRRPVRCSRPHECGDARTDRTRRRWWVCHWSGWSATPRSRNRRFVRSSQWPTHSNRAAAPACSPGIREQARSYRAVSLAFIWAMNAGVLIHG